MVTDDLKPNEIGSFLVEMWTTVVRRFLDARKRIAADGKHAGQIFDLPFTAFSNDPLAAVERIYPFLGLKLEGETRDRMKAWLAEDVALGKKGAAGKHEYAPEWFGLDEAELAKHPSFVEYMETLSK